MEKEIKYYDMLRDIAKFEVKLSKEAETFWQELLDHSNLVEVWKKNFIIIYRWLVAFCNFCLSLIRTVFAY